MEIFNRKLIIYFRLIDKQTVKMEILDDCSNTIDYIAKRLNWDQMTKENVLKSYPSIAKCNVTKVIKQKNVTLFMLSLPDRPVSTEMHGVISGLCKKRKASDSNNFLFSGQKINRLSAE